MRVAAKHGVRAASWLGVLCCCVAASLPAQQAPVTAQVEILNRTAKPPTAGRTDASNVVVWLTLLDPAAASASAPRRAASKLVQRDKIFEPRILVVQVGSNVEFPNQDPFLHNVFSLFDGKRFDLGFYESGSSRSVRFDRQGVSFLFCNIHPEMSAVVVAVATPYFGVSDRSGRVAISGVPDGRYRLQVWYERSSPENLKSLDRVVAVSATQRSLPAIQVVENSGFTPAHKNKYGQDYIPPSGPLY